MDGETTENCPCCGVACTVGKVVVAPNGKDCRIERHPLTDSQLAEHCHYLEGQIMLLKREKDAAVAALYSACGRIVDLEAAVRQTIQELNQ